MSEPVIKPWSYKCFAGCEDVEALAELDEAIDATAHYDDAKAAEGGEG